MTDQVIDIPGVGQVAFPASMSDAEITRAIKDKILPQQKGFVDKAADTVNGAVNWAGTQFTKGITGALGMPDTLGEVGKRGAEWAGAKLGAPELGKSIGGAFKSNMTFGGLMPTTEGMNDAIFNKAGVPEVNAADNPALTLTNPLGIEGNVNVGKMLDAGMQAVPAGVAGPGGALAKAVPAFASGATSEAAGQATEGSNWEIPARIAVGFLGYKGGQRAVTPLPANLTPEQSRLVEMAKSQGVPLTVGQETGRGRGIESALARFPTSQGRMAAAADDQQTAINRLALREAGAEGERLDPTTMNRVIDKASREFEAAKQTSGGVTLDSDFFKKIGDVIEKYKGNTSPSDIVPSVGKRAQDFVKLTKTGPAGTLEDPTFFLGTVSEKKVPIIPTLTGAEYQAFRKGLNDAAYEASNPGAKKALQGMRDALDDAMRSSLPADQAAAWDQVRKNWANLKILTKAAAGGTADSRNAGNLSPSALSMALRQRQGADRFSSTEGGLNDTARLASYLADTRPNSGTPQTLAMQSMLTGGPIAGGYAMGGPAGAAGAAALMATPNLMARAMTGTGGGGAIRRYLANQAVDPRLLSVDSVPFALAPGLVTMPRLDNRQ